MTSSACSQHPRRVAGCPDCCRIASAYDRKRRAAKRAGTWKPQVPQERVEEHLNGLLTAGATLPGIAEASGLPLRTLHGIRRRKWVQGSTADAIFAVDRADAPPRSGHVSVIGASRRVRALAAIGWSLAEQARQLGVVTQQMSQFANETYPTITAANDQTVRGLFERLCGTPGGSVRARNYAQRKGWLPPLAWDDLDDPDAVPSLGESRDDVVDEVAMERALSGEKVELSDAELVAVLQAGVARGEPLSKLADRLGINYFGAKKLVGGELTPRRVKQAAVEAELRKLGDGAPDWAIAALLGVHHSTVRRARERLAAERAVA